MTSSENRQRAVDYGLQMPLIQQYNKPAELSSSHVFKLRPEELSLFFRKDHIEVPANQGEKRESLIILEKVGLIEGLLKKLGTEATTGIVGDKRDLTRRRTFFGINTKGLPKLKTYLDLLWEQCQEQTIKILFVSGIVSLVIGLFNEKQEGAWIEGISIMFACGFITVLSSLCNWGKNKQYLKLHDEIKNEEVSVIRGQYGLSQVSKVSDIVVGDVILIEAGMRIPADCLLIDGMDITCDESMYQLGENTKKSLSLGEEHHLQNPDPFLLSRSLVKSGSGRAIVCAVGEHTRWFVENPVEDLEDDNNLTPLQTKLDNLASYIGRWSYIAGFVTFVFMLVFLFSKILFSDDALLEDKTLQKLLRSFTTAVAIVIVSVPEGLPLAVSIAMAFSVDYMKTDNLLVKKMASVESLGYVRDICTGKTATLTQNDQRVKKFYVGEESFDFGGSHGTTLNSLNENVKDVMVDCIIQNCDARVEMSDEGYYEPVGNGTEVAMLRFLQDNEISVQDLLAKRQRESEHECKIPFNPIIKRQTTVIRPYKGCETVRIVVKGAPEIIMPMCTRMLDSQGNANLLSEDMKAMILKKDIIEHFASNCGYRAFVYAYKDIDSQEWEELQEHNNNFVEEAPRTIVEQNLTFLAAFGIEDKLRPKVFESVMNLKQSNITVRMISGDNFETATRAAVKAGIIKENQRTDEEVCMTGEQLMEILGGAPIKTIVNGQEKHSYPAELKDTILRCVSSKIRVLARCTPEHKFAFIVALQTVGQSVAVTADGLNDVPALNQANVGFCMGSGCEIAKDSSDIIFLDDNFNSVFKATLWGRNILDNIRKFIQFQLPINIVCVALVFLGGATLGNSPFSVIQLLWLNLIMDTLAAISLATEPPSKIPEKWGLHEKRKKDDKIILPFMWRNILVQAAYQLLVLVVMLYSVPYWFGIGYNYVNTDFYGSDVDQIVVPSGNSTTPVDPAVPSQDVEDYVESGLPPNERMLQHFTILFHTFVLMNLFNQIACRKLGWSEINFISEIFNNKWFFFVLSAEFGLQWCIVQYFGNIFRTFPLTVPMHITCFAFGIGSLLVNIAVKKGLKDEEKFTKYFEFNFNENNDQTQYNAVFTMANGLTTKINKSETMRLLDSNSSV